MQTQQEVFKDIPGYEGLYQVSNLGRVKSLDRIVIKSNGFKMIVKEKILKLGVDSRGYLQANLCNEGKQKNIKAHQLVARTFLNHNPCGHKIVVDHINNIKTDNRVENLQLISTRENCSKDKKNKTSKYTGVHWSNKFNKWVANIRVNGRRKSLGYFDSEEEASIVYVKTLNDYIELNITPSYRKKTSNYIGVSWVKRRNRWCATIQMNGIKKQIGYFLHEEDAHNAYECFKNNLKRERDE